MLTDNQENNLDLSTDIVLGMKHIKRAVEILEEPSLYQTSYPPILVSINTYNHILEQSKTNPDQLIAIQGRVYTLGELAELLISEGKVK
jgi:hypothetical protein